MALPKITTSQHELVIPSTGKTIKYRPFLVKEEKVLIIALESQDAKQITNAVKQVLKECVITRGVKIEDLSSFDIEYLFLNVRGKSVGETIDLIITCGDDGVTQIPVTVPIDEILVETNPEHNQEIKLNSEYTLKMKYPSMSQFISANFGLTDDENEVEKSFDIIADCIDLVYDAENVYAGSDTSKKEKIEWIESLTSEQFQMIEKFFNTMPRLTYTVQVTNPNTKKENTVVLEGLADFFA
tara:strand:+ start:4378 stop:5100 length:723 start_codon:yes stop_codon:yes gene_type:complete